MKRKVMEIHENGMNLVCIKDDGDKYNPYKLYHVWYNQGKHRKQIAKYGDFYSVICRTKEILGGMR